MSTEFFEVEADRKYIFPMDRYYWMGDTPHVWAKPENDGLKLRLGFDMFAQRLAGPVLYARTRKIGKIVKQGKSFGTIETAKWIGPLRSPFTGEIVAVNEELKEKPELINTDPFESWMAIIKITYHEVFEEEKKSDSIL